MQCHDGRKHYGWLAYGGSTYYLGGDAGYRLTGWQRIGNRWYLFNSNGQLIRTRCPVHGDT